ncbi:MAG: MFS transporter [Actinomycetia bacterium]|nr:MFS transporter [Actinomycetes bacterium]
MSTPLKRQIHNIGRRRAWAIWTVGVAAYVLAVFHRTSLGVAGLLAADRFSITAAELSTFVVLQLSVYAVMQIPVGIALDRYGPKRLILLGLVLMTAGQMWFAFAGTFQAGVAARVLLGAGDAMIFVSLMRLVALWFRVKQAPLVTQLTGIIGQFGAIASAAPLSYALARFGWTDTFAVAASLGFAAVIAVLVIVKDSPYSGHSIERIKVRALAWTMRDIWQNPGTRLGMYSHFTSMFGANVFGLLWGYPFLVVGQGLSSPVASSLIMLMTVTAVVVGPVTGRFVSRHPYQRSWIVLGIVVAIMAVWAVVLLWPGRAPLWLLGVLVVVTAAGGPVSMVSFDMARTFHRPDHLGRATGVVNMGGFVASLAAMWAIGFILDLRAPGGPGTYTLEDFRVAMSVMFVFWFFGAIQVWRYRQKSKHYLEELSPGSLERLRHGEALLPGVSRELD